VSASSFSSPRAAPAPGGLRQHTGWAVTDDGRRLAFQVTGPAPGTSADQLSPLLVLNGLVSSTQHWVYFTPHFGARRPVITWDYLGHGASASAPGGIGPVTADRCRVSAFADDARAVLKAARQAGTVGERPAVAVGLSYGVQVALELHRRHSGSVAGLVLICGTAGHPLDRISSSSILRRTMAGSARALGLAGRPAAILLGTAGRLPLIPELAYLTGGAHRDLCPREILQDIARHAMSLPPALIGHVAGGYFEHSAHDHLSRVQVPALIISGDRDQLTPVSCAEHMHREIRGSRLQVIPGHTHLVQLERPEVVHAAIDDFLAGAAATA
jgi:pimeloyl-ACP methyl ester carboxylesterase